MTYKNGALPASALRNIGGGVKLAKPTASALLSLIADAKHVGIHVAIVSAPNGAAGYRSLAVQEDMLKHPSYYGVVRGVVLAPVGASTHGLGHAIDIAGGQYEAGLKWMITNAHRHGFTHPNPATDPGHFFHSA